ncbi:MAG: ABC transporter permease [Gemmatimonadota bacterium]|nr:MAG: ABC transporter permease [Gemmatimonadota bacterium]
MRDWKAYVRARLALPALRGLRDERIVEELAGQLEDLCREHLARGVPEAEAEELAAAHVTDWDELARRITTAERKNRQPVAAEWVEDRARDLERRGRTGAVAAELVRNIRYALRSARREPGFWAVTVLILGLGIGATTAIFSVVDGVLLKSLPYHQPDRLVYFDGGSFPMPRVADFVEHTTSFASLTGVWDEEMDWTGGDRPLQLNAALVLPGYLELFDAQLAVGRLLLEEDFQGAPHRAVLSWGAWQRLFGGDPGAVGRSLTMDGNPVQIVGVLDAGFASPAGLTGRERDVFVALDPHWQELQVSWWFVIEVYGRLREGVTVAVAQDELDAAIARLADVHPQLHRSRDGNLRAVTLLPLQTSLTGSVRGSLQLLLGAVGLLLLIACANVANLLLARGTERHHELAVRSAIGAGRIRILAQVLTESLIFALAGGLVGVVVAIGGVRAFEMWNPGGIPLIERVAVDGRVLAFALAVSLLTGVLFGTAPALQGARLNVSAMLKEGGRAGEGRDRGRLRRTLVVVEIAMALVLLTGAGLLFNSFLHLTSVRPGFDAAHLAGVELRMGDDRYDEQARVQFVRRLLPRIERIPGVRAAAVSITVPFQYYGGRRRGWWQERYVNDEGAEIEQSTMIQPVSPNFFATIGAELRGDDLSSSAADEFPIPVVLSQSLADRLFEDRNPIGRGFQGLQQQGGLKQLRVVGVVSGLHHWGLDQGDRTMLYVSWERWGADMAMTALVVRTAGDPAAVLPALRDAIWELDPDMALPNVFTVSQRMAQSVATPKFYSALLIAFAAVALLLAAGGIYGAMLYTVGRRRRELAVRAALGADGRRLLRLVLWQSARVTALGLAIGGGGALAATRALRGMLFGVSATDPTTLTAVAVLMGSVALGASLVPAWRAARANPVEAMRAE